MAVKNLVNPEMIIKEFQAFLSDGQVYTDPILSKEIDGFEHPVVIVEPMTEQEVSDILAIVNEQGLHAFIIGSGTQLGHGNVPEKVEVVIRTLRMNQILEYSPADMTVTVQAGILFKDLQEHLAKHGQMLPINPPSTEHATVGGLVATDVSGPMRVLYGTFRDHTIGLRVVYPTGAVIRTGGKVVKNVAGYDMTKLFIGSLGTLAFLSEITFKLKPLPIHQELCVIRGNLAQIQEISGRIINSHLIPSSFEIVSKSFSNESNGSPWVLSVGCDEVESAAAYQSEVLHQWAQELGLGFAVDKGQQVKQFWERYFKTAKMMQCKVKVSTKATTILADIEAIQRFAERLNLPIFISISLPQGTALVGCQEGSIELWEKLVKEIRQISELQNGFAMLLHGPIELRTRVDAFGTNDSTFQLMKGIKQTIDPNRILSPGRFVGGI